MATVTKPHGDFVNNVDVANASYVDDQFNTLYNLVNGGLDSANAPSLGYAVTAISATATLTSSKVGIIECTAGANGITLTLPSAATAGLRFILKKVDSGVGVVTINTTGSQTIDGQLNRTLVNQYAEIHVISNGSNWDVIIENIVDLPTFAMSRQALINGNFDVWQRGTTFTVGVVSYNADRWQTLIYGTGSVECSRVDISADLSGSQFGVRLKNTGANTASIHLGQPIRTANTKKMLGKKVTLSFKARKGMASTAASLTMDICSSSMVDDGTLSSFTDINTVNVIGALTANFTEFSLTVDSALAASINTLGIKFIISYAAGANGGANDYIDIAQVQLNVGDTALPFQAKGFEEELGVCERYYEKSYSYADAPASNTIIGVVTGTTQADNSGVADFAYPFKVPKRVNPTVKYYISAGTPDVVNISTNGSTYTTFAAMNGNSPFQSEKLIGVRKTALTAGQSSVVQFHFTADSEI